METGVILGLFIAALTYLGGQVWRQFRQPKAGCAKGCSGACSTIDFQKIETEMARRENPVQRI